MPSKILTAVALLCMLASADAVIIDRVLAIVNEEVVTQSEVYSIQSLNLDISGLPARDKVLQRRVDHRLVLQQIKNQPPVEITEDDVKQALAQYSAKFETQEALMSFLNSVGMNYPDLEKEIREQISIRKFIGLRFRPFVNITIEEAEKYYNEVHKPLGQEMGQPVSSFEESFPEIQTLLVETKVEDKVKDWLEELRSQSEVFFKE